MSNFLLTVRFSIKQRTFATYYEPILHLLCIWVCHYQMSLLVTMLVFYDEIDTARRCMWSNPKVLCGENDILGLQATLEDAYNITKCVKKLLKSPSQFGTN